MDLFSLVARLTLDSSEYDSELDDAEKKGSSFGSKIGTAAKGVAAGVTAITGATVAVGGAFIKSAGDVASYGDNIDKASQKVGISAKAYQEWDAILQHSGSSASALTPAMKTLQKQAQKNSTAFQELGISEQDVANMSKEELFAATITGLQNVQDESKRSTLATELLGRGAMEMGALLNTSAEDTEAMRKKVHELGGVMSDEAVKSAAAYQDSLQDMQTAFDGVKRNLVSSFLPSITTVMDGLGTLFSGDGKKGLGQIKEGVSKFITNLTETVPKVIEVGTKIVTALGSAIVENLPAIFNAGVKAILELAKGISKSLPDLIPQAVDAVMTLVEGLLDNIDELVEAGVDLIVGLATGLVNAIPVIIEKIPLIIGKLVEALVNSAPKIATAGVTLLTSLVKSLPTIITTIVKSIPSIITNIVKAFIKGVPQLLSAGAQLIGNLGNGIVKGAPNIIKAIPTILKNIVNTFLKGASTLLTVGTKLIGSVASGISKGVTNALNVVKNVFGQIVKKIAGVFNTNWSQIGKNIITGIGNGLSSMGNWIYDKAKSIGSTIWTGFKNFFGIKSPSKLMADTAKYIPMGVAKGIEDNLGYIDKAMMDMDTSIGSVNVPKTAPTTGYLATTQKQAARDLTVILELERTPLAKAVYRLNNEETQRVGLKLAGGYA